MTTHWTRTQIWISVIVLRAESLWFRNDSCVWIKIEIFKQLIQNLLVLYRSCHVNVSHAARLHSCLYYRSAFLWESSALYHTHTCLRTETQWLSCHALNWRNWFPCINQCVCVCVCVNAWVHFLLLTKKVFHKSILIINKVWSGLSVVIIIGLNDSG